MGRSVFIEKTEGSGEGDANKPASTKDSHSFYLYANADTKEEVQVAKSSSCEGIGLFRTEHCF